MADSFKSSNYNKNLNFLIQVIKLKDTKKIDKQYNETVRDLSQALKNFTNKAEDIAKFVIYTDLNNYVEPVDKKPLGLFGALKEIWLGKDAPVKNDNIRNFAKDKLPNPPLEKAAEYTNIFRKINLLKERLDTLKEILDSRQSEKEEHKLHAVNLESVTTSKQRKEEQLKKEAASNRMKKIKRPTMAPPPPPAVPNELKPEPQKKVATTEKKKVRFKSKPEIILFDDSGYGSLSDEESDKKISNYQEKELIYATAPKEHIEAKRANKQQQQSKPTIPPKLPVVPPISKKATDLGQKAKKDKPTIPPKPKNLGLADQQVSMKPRIVGVTPNESKVTPAAQADIGVEKNPPKAAFQSHLLPAGNERSEMNPITAKSDPKPSASKQPLIMHVSVKEIAARFESHGKK